MTDPRNQVPNPGLRQISDLAQRVHDAVKDELSSDPPALYDLPHGSGATELQPHDVRWLRGRVVVEVLPDVQSDVLVLPNQEDRERRVGPALVRAMGPFAVKYGKCQTCLGLRGYWCEDHEDCTDPCDPCGWCGGSGRDWIEIDPGYRIGDTVYVQLPHKSRAIEMGGKSLHVVAQEEVKAYAAP